MITAVVDNGYNLGILKHLFEDSELLGKHGLESVELKPIIMYDTDSQRSEAVERTGQLYDNADELVVPYEKGLERLKALAGNIDVLVITCYLGREGAGLDLIGDVRRGNLGEKLREIPVAVIADFGDPLSSHEELKELEINLFIDYITNDTTQDALLELIREVKEREQGYKK